MRIKINPINLPGLWNGGFALDFQTLDSIFLGHNHYGRPQCKTTRSPVGELRHNLKYKNDQNAVPKLLEAIMQLWKMWEPVVDAIIPVPPSERDRKSEPVLTIATAWAERLGVRLLKKALLKIKDTPEMKNIEPHKRLAALEGCFMVDSEQTAGKKILLLDDLYDSGATVVTITNILKNEGKAKVYLLELTRTKKH